MAIHIAVNIGFMVVGDGTTKSFQFNLAVHPYEVPTEVKNWMNITPTGVLSAPGEYTATLTSGQLVTVNFVNPPPAGVGTEFGLIVTF